jgi:glycosyltransferase involved in cell wall biosynthesis
MKKLKIAMVSTYPPRECGIATFSQNLRNALVKQLLHKTEVFVTAVQAPQDDIEYPVTVEQIIRQERQKDYIEAAEYINYSGADLCLIQHEYGIYGGESGIYLLSLIHQLTIPVFATLHTVLETPSFNEKVIIQEIAAKAEKLIVMSNKSIKFLIEIYGVPAEKIQLIPHGVPNISYKHGLRYKQELNLENNKLLLTFGLLNRNKGIETVIKALPQLVKKHPSLVYIVLGKTHPLVKKISGEEYRNYLIRLVEKLGLEKYVHFHDKFISEKELIQYLAAADIYVTPYLNKRQSTSGTLSYAIGAGAAVISTPYWHAEEMLAKNRGYLFDFNNEQQLAAILLPLLNSPRQLEKARHRAYTYGRKMGWPVIGGIYRELFKKSLKNQPGPAKKIEGNLPFTPGAMPDFRLDHVVRLTDDTGIVQHARYSIPNLKEGYCTDDNARALIMTLMAYRQEESPEALRLMGVYLKFLMYMQNEDGSFRNFLSFDRKFLDEKGTDDSFGRTVWALGYLIHYPPNEVLFQIGKEMFEKALTHIEKIRSLRGIAYGIVGLAFFLYRYPDNERCAQLLKRQAQIMTELYKDESSLDWQWFEKVITYGNGMLPLALLHAYKVLRIEELRTIALESLAFLEKIKFKQDYLSVIGSNGWYPKGGKPAIDAQQPVNAMAMVLLYHTAYSMTKDQAYLEKMYKCYKWFLGDNFLRMPLYDFESKGCNDGLEKDRVSHNQGAESSLSFLISHMTVLIAHEELLYNLSKA